MNLKTLFPLAVAGLVLLNLPACASSAPAASAADTLGTDLGPSSRVPRSQLAMAMSGHDMKTMSHASNAVTPVHEGGSDAHATGTVNSVDAKTHKVNMSHQPLPALGWPAMTMDFDVAPSVDLSRIKPGSRVNFSLEKDKGGMYQIQSIEPANGRR
jgi:Cu(I)/Ag(I) efflux system periplasmic protein CusF